MPQHSRLETVFVQSKNGIPCDEAFYKAWEGFRKKQVDCKLFEAAELHERRLELSKTTLVVGGVRVVEAAMRQLGIEVPAANNLPRRLEKYRGRKVSHSTLGKLRIKYQPGEPRGEALFIKPLTKNKGFPALALYDADDLTFLDKFADDEPVLVSEYVVFVSEWRCFVIDGQVINLSHYQGDMFMFPDADVIHNAINDYGNDAPAGYGIDFGVLTDGKTVLVECNEGYSLGSYGINAVEYADLLEARWLQLAR